MKDGAWLVATSFLMLAAFAGATHLPDPAATVPYLRLSIDDAILPAADAALVTYTVYGAGQNISGSVKVNDQIIAQSLNVPLFSGTFTLARAACDTVTVQGVADGHVLSQHIESGSNCDGALAGIAPAASVTARGPGLVAGSSNWESKLELGLSSLGSIPQLSLAPEPDAWSSSATALKFNAQMIHSVPWCGFALATETSTDPLSGASSTRGARVTYTGNICPTNFPPTLELGPDQVKKMKGAFVLEGLISDPDDDSHLVWISWGDHDTEVVYSDGDRFTASHVYSGKGTWTVTACANDADHQACDTMQITQGGAAKDSGDGGGKDGGGKGGGKGNGKGPKK